MQLKDKIINLGYNIKKEGVNMNEIKLYENKEIRSVWDNEKEIKRRGK
ncbi:hypothetical protein [Streptobacillus ratti]|nr:hypothetical protein [Streptobacillus ratti]